VSEKVARELCAAIENATEFRTTLMIGLRGGVLDQFESPVIPILYRRLATSQSAGKRIIAIAGCIRGGDAAALDLAAASVSDFPSNPVESDLLIANLRDEFRSTDQQSIAALARIAGSSASAPMQKAAAHALASIHTREALPFLAAFLDSPDPDLRAEGIG